MPLVTPASAEETAFSSLFADDPQMLLYQNSLVRLRKCLVHFRLYVRGEVASFMAALSGPVGFTGVLIDAENSSIGNNVQQKTIETLAIIEEEIIKLSNLSQSIAAALSDLCQVEIKSILEDNEFINTSNKTILLRKKDIIMNGVEKNDEVILSKSRQYLRL